MLLFSVCITLLSPITIISVTSVSLPKVDVFKHMFLDVPSPKKKMTKRLSIECRVSGNPKPKLEYQFNGITITNSSRVKQIGNFLNIDDVKYPSDEGMYRCVATNTNGKVYRGESIKIPSIGEFLAGKSIEDRELFHDVILGEELELVCPQHTYAFPVKYFWGYVHNNFVKEIIQDTPNIHTTQNGRLFFSSITKDDVEQINAKGGVSCIVQMGSNLLPQTIFSRKNGLSIVGTNVNDSAPRIMHQFGGHVYAQKDATITLICLAKGNPLPDIRWYRNGVQIHSNDSQYGINPHLTTKLTIKRVHETIVGQFKCEASNRVGKDEHYGRLLLAEPAKLVTTLEESVKVPQGNSLNLVCSASGTAPISYSWHRNGSRLSSYSFGGITMTIKDGVLTISSVQYSDQGVYQCTARNQYGSSSSVGNVLITAPKIDTTGQTGKRNSSGNDGQKTATNVTPNKNVTKQDNDEPLKMQHIILIACGGSVFVIVLAGGIFLYCRTKNDHKDVRFIATPRHELHKPIYVEPDLPQPPRYLTDSDDDLTSNGGVKNAPEFISLMSERGKNYPQNPESVFYDIPEDVRRSNTIPKTDV